MENKQEGVDQANGVDASVNHQAIRRLDASILELLNKRLAILARPVRDSRGPDDWIDERTRQGETLEYLVSINDGRLDSDGIRRIFSEIMSVTRQSQKPKTISFFGPEATFTHIAARNYFDADDQFVAQPGIQDVFDEVEKGSCQYGVVPVENSIEGSVNHTLDLFLESNLKICAETYLVISHDLLSTTDQLKNIQVIYSHPQPFAQCRGWLKKNLPNVELVECSSTAQAAQKALVTDKAAAIAGSEAAQLYGLEVVASKIQDVVRNTTRFLIIGKDNVRPTGHDKTSIMFVTTHVPGALFQVLEPIAESGINMMKLESRPAKYENWSYVFFVDLEGHATDAIVSQTLAQMKELCQFLKILGSYPVARQKDES